MSEKKKGIRLIDIITVIMLIGVLMYVFNLYKDTTFNDFIRTEYNMGVSNFSRDKEIKYSDTYSYKIESDKFNDTAFYKTVEVTPNTPYKVSCMVKTKNVITENEVSESGAHISILDTVEKSPSVVGTEDWQKIELLFNSKNRTSVDIGFRLGGYEDNCTGTAWFSDFKIESGVEDNSKEWNFACFILENVDIENTDSGYNVTLNMSQSDIGEMKSNMQRFKNSCEELSGYNMSVNYDIIEINEPLKSLSYDEKSGYYVAPEDVMHIIDPYLLKEEYDHIFICVRLGDMVTKTEYDWLGLGGMSHNGMGFSNIRLPNDRNSYTYKYNALRNTFPEEVFLHEFLHTLERNQDSYDYEVPELHDYQVYGYKNEALTGQREWYRDYMQKNVDFNGKNIGLESFIYTAKPVHESDFIYSYDFTNKVYYEPQNVIDDFMFILKRVKNAFSEKVSLSENVID